MSMKHIDFTKEHTGSYKERLQIKQRKFYLKNKKELLKKQKDYYSKNKEERAKYYRFWWAKNKTKQNKINSKYNIIYRLENDQERIKHRIRAHLRKIVLCEKDYKTMRINKNIDYCAIIEHLKPFPDNIEEYHIDHIQPLSSFDLTKDEEVAKAFAPENHQWLLAYDNLVKSNKVMT